MPPTGLNIPALLQEQSARLSSRFVAACEAASLDTDGLDLKSITSAWAVSPFLAELAITSPDWFITDVVNTNGARRELAYYRDNVLAALQEAVDAGDTFSRLRQFRNQALARIAWRDIVCRAEVLDITAELSDFADACLTGGVGWAAQQLVERFGDPRDSDGRALSMAVIALGKLGGRELNFSSDIDLIFAFPQAGKTHGGRREISNQEYFDKLGKLLIALLDERTDDGFVFSVDMRLRPFGDSGPLTSNFDALEHYYQLHGRDWERYAFIKARLLTPSERDRDKLQSMLKPFVYRRYLDYGALAAVREMKALIGADVARQELQDNVKLGSGGIREIEFIGQTFQLIRGGQEPSLQQRPIVAVLEASATLKLLDKRHAAALTAAYLFLRRTEHRLQQVADQQTHQLPDTDVEQTRIAFGMGFADYAAFKTALSVHRDTVRGCFQTLLAPQVPRHDESSQDLRNARSVWFNPPDENNFLPGLVVDDPEAFRAVLNRLIRPRFLDQLSREGRQRLDRLMPRLIDSICQRAPFAATFARLAKLIQAIARRSVYLSLLDENPVALERLIDLYHASPWIAGQITQQPLLLDELLDPRALFAPPDRVHLIAQLETLLTRHGRDDIERLMDTLRNFKNQQVLRVTASDIMEQFPVAEVSNQLSFIADALLHHALTVGRDLLIEKHGEPYHRVDGDPQPVGFAIIAYGKLGGFELGYGSDLDLVFLHDGHGQAQQTGGQRSIVNSVFFTRLTQRIIHFLSTRTAAGRAYEVDTRLRPSGESGLLVSSMNAFFEYQQRQSWTWEHQALFRARAVTGDPATMAAFEKVRFENLSKPRDANQLRIDIAEMRLRMRTELDRSDSVNFDLKQGVGGITDIEFMVQYGVLCWAHEHHELLAFTDNLRLLEVLIRLGLMTTETGTTLHDAYFAYRAAVHRCALQEIDGLVDQTSFCDHRRAVAEIWRKTIEPPPA